MEDGSAGSEPSGLAVEPATPEQVERAENLIRQANLAKIRGDQAAADKLLDEATQTAAGSSPVQEALGDAFLERKQVRKARDCFKRAMELDPKNPSAERKYGECVLAIEFAVNPDFGKITDDSFASGKAGVLLSFLLPGLGQSVSGETTKGISLLAVWVACLVWAFLTPNGLSGLPTLIGRKGTTLNPVVFVPLFGMAACWLAAIGDASARAKRFEPKSIVRPTPPVDKEF